MPSLLRHVLRLLALLAVTAGMFSACAPRRPVQAPRVASTLHVLESGERAGLGTAWGEARESWIEPAYFARAWGDRPSAMDKLFYNDREGVDAMAAYLGGDPTSAPGLQPAARGMITMGLRDAGGRWFETLKLPRHRMAVGERGARYEVVLKNETRRRLEVVLSVDGLDPLDGKTASYEKRGYVVPPRGTLCVEGFRSSNDRVAAFRFTNVGNSYAQRRFQDTANVGVVGLAVFAEKWTGTPAGRNLPENRAWRQTEPRDPPSDRVDTTPPDA